MNDMAQGQSIIFKNSSKERCAFGDNGYGEIYVILRGPRGGERGDFLLSKGNVWELIDFLTKWLMVET